MITAQNTKIDQNIVDKINKLLALSTSPNEHESAAAAAKVSTLLAQYNLSLSDLGSGSDEDFGEYLVEPSKTFVIWKMTLLHGIAYANGCEAIHVRHGENAKNMMLIGYPTNCIIVHNLYEYLLATIERLAKEQKSKGRAFVNAFKVGCASRLCERLESQRKEMETSGIPGDQDSPHTSAIVVKSMFEKTDALVKKYLKEAGARKIKPKCSDDEGFDSGYDSADQISLNKQVNHGKTKQLVGV